MSPRWKKAIGDLRAHRGRTLLAMVAIALGLAAAGTVLDTWALVRVATRDGYLASDPAAATLRFDSIPAPLRAAVLDAVRGVPGVRAAESRRTTTARVQMNGAVLTAFLFTSDDLAGQRIGRLRSDLGAWPPGDGEFVIEHSSLDFSGAAVGEPVRLTAGDGPTVELMMSGVARDVGLAPGWMEHVVYGFVPRSTLRALGISDADDEVRLVVEDGTLDREGVRRIATAARGAAESAGVRVGSVDVPEPGEHVHAAQMDSLLYTQGAFGVLALFLAAFLVVNLIAAMLAGQVREIGVLKAIGGRTTQIASLYLAVAAMLGAASAAVAVPIAMLAGERYAALKADLLNFDLTGHTLPLWVPALQVAVGILLPVLASIPTVRRACRVPVGEALRDVGIHDEARVPAVLHRVSGVSRPVLLSLRNAFRKRQRMVLTLLALSTAGAVFLGALGLRRGVLGATDLLFAAQRFDFGLRLAAPQSPDSLSAIVREVQGVEAAEVWTGATATLARTDGTFGSGFPVQAPPASTTLLVPPMREGRWLRAEDSLSLVIGRGLLREDPTLRVGGTLRLLIAGHTDEWTIVGIAETGTGPAAFATREAIMARTGEGATTVIVRSALRGDGAQLELIQRMRQALLANAMPVASSVRVAEQRRSIEDHLLMVVDFLSVMGWLMLVVGALGLASTMAIGVLERTREIGVLRAIGARDGAILAIVQAEGLTIGLLSWAIALPLSVPMSLALGAAFGRIMLPVPVRIIPDGTAVLAWLALVLVVSVGASAWPAWRAMRVPAARALSYE